jgi:hypothetical protein
MPRSQEFTIQFKLERPCHFALRIWLVRCLLTMASRLLKYRIDRVSLAHASPAGLVNSLYTLRCNACNGPEAEYFPEYHDGRPGSGLRCQPCKTRGQ